MKNFTKNGAPPLPRWAEVASRDDLVNRPLILRVLQNLQKGNFRYAIEPIYCMATQDTLFQEILLRLVDENGNQISPLEVFATVEENNLMEEVSLYLLYYQLLYRNVLESTGSMNVNPQLLATPEARARFWQLLEAYAAEGQANRVILEVLEIQPLPITPELTAFMEEVAALGFKWALDDFGDGYHTLAHIQKLPLDYVKLCNSYSLALAKDPYPRHRLELVLQACRERNIPIVAENISTAEQMENLHNWHGISLSQSYAFPKA